MNVLISSAGRRGNLVRLFREAVQPLEGQIFATDAGRWSAACRLAHDWDLVPLCSEDSFIPTILDICNKRNIKLIILTIDTELQIFSEHREHFAENGIHVAVSGLETIDICRDKLLTYEFLAKNKLPGAKILPIPSDDSPTGFPFPVVIKPRFGSASEGVNIINDEAALRFYLNRTTDPIVQEKAAGKEYTVNFFADGLGGCITSVPHRRIEVRGGEVSKCVTEKIEDLGALANSICRMLPDAWGPMCFQAFVDDLGNIHIIEINARFGGGYPIAHAAGADFIQMLLRHVRGEALAPADIEWQEGIAMTRWDDAVFTNAADVGL